MSELSAPARDSVAAQQELFRRAAQEEGLTINTLHAKDMHLKKSTMRDWAAGRAVIPAWALGALGEAGVPDHLLSLVYAPYTRSITTEEDGDGDLDTAATEAIEFAAEVQRARHPHSPGGVQIVPQEKVLIHPKRQRACAAFQRAARA